MLNKEYFEQRHGAKFDPRSGSIEPYWIVPEPIQGNEPWHGGTLNLYSGTAHIKPAVRNSLLGGDSLKLWGDMLWQDEKRESFLDVWYRIDKFLGDPCAKITRRSKLLCCMTSGTN